VTRIVVIALASLLAAAPTTAQTSLEVQVGAVGSGALAEDSIVNPITVGPAPGLGVTLGVMTEFDGPFHAGARVGWAHSNVRSRELDTKATVLPLTVWTGVLALGIRITGMVRAEARFGAVKYAPGGETNGTIFQDAAPLTATAGLGARVDRRVNANWTLGLHAAIDLHQFDTPTLRTAGFAGARTVHRISVGATVRWGKAPDQGDEE
jgi:hypothetical protein